MGIKVKKGQESKDHCKMSDSPVQIHETVISNRPRYTAFFPLKSASNSFPPRQCSQSEDFWQWLDTL